ncbi:MAG: hypothetical protein OHK93_002765 [Ramalina farinacea]|uniref:Uncharacterized protein n=1 Tax=Ramalina farinacea TaxID=258253 RepID=A0AA43QRZ9_9LECA|nr:hypothetical protein [Ramalina farinacea]
MYFTKGLLTLLASTTLTTLVTSTPIDSKAIAARDAEAAKLAPRFQNFDDQVKGSADAWAALTQYCGGGSSKRDLEARAPQPPGGPWNEVKMGDSQAFAGIPIGLWTQNLKSCIGFGITADGGNHALGHFTSDESSKESQWDKFSGLVNGWTNIQGYVSKPDRSTNVDSIMTDEALDLMDKVTAQLIARMNSLGHTRITLRSMAPGSGDTDNTMSIDGQNNVLINGNAP